MFCEELCPLYIKFALPTNHPCHTYKSHDFFLSLLDVSVLAPANRTAFSLESTSLIGALSSFITVFMC